MKFRGRRPALRSSAPADSDPAGETEYDRVLLDFERLESAFIDTSSMILSEKAGFLDSLARTMGLFTVPGAAREFERRAPGAALPEGITVVGAADGEPRAADDALLLAARRRGLPLLSEDRKLLLRADAAGLLYYNSLVMLEFLLFREKISPADRARHRGAMLSAARYAPRVTAWAEGLHWAVMKRRG